MGLVQAPHETWEINQKLLKQSMLKKSYIGITTGTHFLTFFTKN
jgi:hypothetical protein